MDMLGYLVDKCHVGESKLQVFRFVLSKVKGGLKSWKAMPRATRKQALAHIMKRHADNQGLYTCVASGRF